jgi:hypothetical protein
MRARILYLDPQYIIAMLTASNLAGDYIRWNLLDLPATALVHHCFVDHSRNAIGFLVEDPSFDIVPEGSIYPTHHTQSMSINVAEMVCLWLAKRGLKVEALPPESSGHIPDTADHLIGGRSAHADHFGNGGETSPLGVHPSGCRQRQAEACTPNTPKAPNAP